MKMFQAITTIDQLCAGLIVEAKKSLLQIIRKTGKQKER
jgi:hypothetical protein